MTFIPPDRDPRRLALRWVEEVWNHRRKGAIDELCLVDLAWDGEEWGSGPDGVRHWVTALVQAVPDLRVEVLETKTSGDRVEVIWQFAGTHTGPGLGLDPTGLRLQFGGWSWMTWLDGRLVEWTGGWSPERVTAEIRRSRTAAD